MYDSDVLHPNKALEEKLQALYTLNRDKKIDLSFRAPYLDLLQTLGDPHKNLPPVLHVAGTNGKGSVIAMLRAVFEEAGYSVHTYTSPHLVRFNERIVLAGKEIDDAQLEALLDEVLIANKGAPATFFEFTTAMAFAAFARKPADILLLETGLGGRLDCTNIIKKPLVTIITTIAYDHMEFLGDRLPEIAAEKAGIMKPAVPCIIARQDNPVIEKIFEKKAIELSCPLFRAAPENIFTTNLTGSHQRENMATVLRCIKALKKSYDFSNEALEKGLQNVFWPARLQKIDMDGINESCEVWLDGGHNESAGRALAAQAKLWAHQDGKPLHLMIGMMKTKDPKAFLTPLLPYINQITCVAVPDEEQAFAPEELSKIIKEFTALPVSFERDITAALEGLKSEGNKNILIAGSLYLAGHILKIMPYCFK